MNKYIITDEEEACEAIKEILKEEYEKNIVDWQRELDRKDSVEKKEFLKVMDQLLRLVGKEQKEGRKEKIEQIYICYLRSSLLVVLIWQFMRIVNGSILICVRRKCIGVLTL